MAKQDSGHKPFEWADLGDMGVGRPNLGPTVPVQVYRLLQYTWRDAMVDELGVEKANQLIVEAGRRAGKQFCENLLDRNLGFNEFVAQLQETLKELSIGILRVEQADVESGTFTLTVSEDLDCSGLPFLDGTVCQYDEGFLAGVLSAYAGKPFQAKEIDCWASGDRVCRFAITPLGGEE